MKQVLQYPRKDGLLLEECPLPACKPNGIIVANRFSLISPGTERAIIDLASQSLAGKARSRPDLVKQVLDKVRTEGLINTLNKVRARLNSPIPLGYSASGVVVETAAGVNEFAVGDRVACAGFGYACHAEQIYVPKNLAVILPAGLSHQEGAFVTLGAIALWGVRQASVTLGERVAVLGLGLLGQITAQLLKASGCQVIGIDIDEQRLTETARFGADLLVNSRDERAAKAIQQFTGGVGVDAVVITAASKSNQPIEFAAEICRDRGRVTIVGDVAMNIPRKPFYDKELSLNLSRSYGPGRYDSSYEEQGIDYPIGYVRWAENRNMRAFLELVAGGKVDVKSLISDTYDIAVADQAFQRIETDKVLGVLLQYSEAIVERKASGFTSSTPLKSDTISVGFLGAGNFATGVLMPALKGNKKFQLKSLYSATPHKARAVADQYQFGGTANSEEELLNDPSLTAIFIATPHNLHGAQVVRALESGKHVFVEKPLCLNERELESIRAAHAKSGVALTVGFNRRYATCSAKMREHLAQRLNPVVFNYTVNAGFIPKKSWIQDDRIGGGRILGEVCHFIDLMTFLLSARVEAVITSSIAGTRGQYLTDDNIVINVTMSDGSTGVIVYTALGDKAFPKEMLEIFTDGQVLAMTDFRELSLFSNGSSHQLYRGAMNKGFDAELTEFVRMILSGQTAAEAESFFHSTEATLSALASLRTGEKLHIT
jgi:predicted dehydrogenase/threonine dehydrogenase-like Zn-dependent dehydrogenase